MTIIVGLMKSFFEAGDVTQTHRIFINNDTECEKEPNENFSPYCSKQWYS